MFPNQEMRPMDEMQEGEENTIGLSNKANLYEHIDNYYYWISNLDKNKTAVGE